MNSYNEYNDNPTKKDFEILNKMIKKFNKLKFNNHEHEYIEKRLKEIMLFGGINFSKEKLSYIDSKFKFFRIVKIDILPVDESYLWNPPKEIVKLGRLNKKNESYLYVCINSIGLVIAESKTKRFENILLIEYKLKFNQILKLAKIGNLEINNEDFNSNNYRRMIEISKEKFINNWMKKTLRIKKILNIKLPIL